MKVTRLQFAQAHKPLSGLRPVLFGDSLPTQEEATFPDKAVTLTRLSQWLNQKGFRNSTVLPRSILNAYIEWKARASIQALVTQQEIPEKIDSELIDFLLKDIPMAQRNTNVFESKRHEYQVNILPSYLGSDGFLIGYEVDRRIRKADKELQKLAPKGLKVIWALIVAAHNKINGEPVRHFKAHTRQLERELELGQLTPENLKARFPAEWFTSIT